MKLASHDKCIIALIQAPVAPTFAESRGARVVALCWGGMEGRKDKVKSSLCQSVYLNYSVLLTKSVC